MRHPCTAPGDGSRCKHAFGQYTCTVNGAALAVPCGMFEATAKPAPVAPGFEEFADQAAQQQAEGRGLRYNAGKVRVDLLPPDALWMLAQLMTVNELKYPDRNWEKGMPLTDIIASLERHTMALKAGEDIDPTDNQPHAVKIMWNGMALATYFNRGIGTDDRVKCGLPEMRPPQ